MSPDPARLLAYGLFAHAVMVAFRLKRIEAPGAVVFWTLALAATVTLQVVVAAAMVLLHLPPFWRAALQVVLGEPIDEELIRALDDQLALVDLHEARGLEPCHVALRIHL